MLNSILDIAIGLVFVYLIVSIMVSSVHEIIASFLNHRGEMLKTGIEEMLSGSKTLAQEILGHPLVQSLQKGERLPSYLPASTFSAVFLDTLCSKHDLDHKVSPSVLLDALPAGNEKRILTVMLDECGDDWTALQARVGQWYEDAMERVSGWYKRNCQLWLFGIALVLSVVCNIDSLNIVQRLWSDNTARSYLAAQAEKLIPQLNPQTLGDKDPYKELGNQVAKLEELRSNQLPIGWPMKTPIIFAILGWLLTALAASLGAPFWFDMLTKLLKIRGTGGKPGASAGGTQENASTGGTKTVAATAPPSVSPASTPSPPKNPAFNKVEAELRQHDIAAIQQALKIPNDKCTGQLDQLTRNEIAKWQKSNGGASSGVLTADQVRELLYLTINKPQQQNP